MPTDEPHDNAPMVLVTEDIDAPPSVIFETLLDAESLPEWFDAPGGGRTSAWSLDPRPGGAWSATTQDASGRRGTLRGEFIDVDAPHTLAFTWHDPRDAKASGIVRFTLDERIVEGESCTRLTVTHVMELAATTHAPAGPCRRSALAVQSVLSARVEWEWRLHALVRHLGQSLVVSTW